jgi:putative endonuclease
MRHPGWGGSCDFAQDDAFGAEKPQIGAGRISRKPSFCAERSGVAESTPATVPMAKSAYVYILANRRHGALYTGVTSDLVRRLHQHQQHLRGGFTSQYEVTRLVWYTQGDDIAAAIALEKKIKNRGRRWKIDLIEKNNPDWRNLADGWTGAVPDQSVD